MASYTGNTYTDKVGDIVADLSKSCYSDANINRFHGDNTGYYDQCTWYAFGRAMERYGGPLDVTGNGGEWYDTIVVGNGVSKRSKSLDPVSKSIASFSDTRAGHVVFIEQVSGGNVYFTEGNGGGADGEVQVKTIDSFKTLWGKKLNGYIVLTKYNPSTGV